MVCCQMRWLRDSLIRAALIIAAVFMLQTGVHAETSSSQLSLAVTVQPKKLGSLGVWVSGLGSNKSVTLQNNGADELLVQSNGGFTFPVQYAKGSNYAISVSNQPAGQICRIQNAMGVVASDLTSLTVICVNTYKISGNMSGLAAGKSLLLTNNGSDSLYVASNGAFAFQTTVDEGGSYSVSVGIQPPGQSCLVTGGAGANVTTDVSSVSVVCGGTYTVSGSVSGLAASGLVIKMNGASKIIARGATSFKFSTALVTGASYAVSVAIQPAGYSCSVTGGDAGNGSGVIGSANVTDLAITCSKVYTVGGSVTGLAYSGLILRLNNASSIIVAPGVSSFKFSTALPAGADYVVSVAAQPVGQTCSVLNGAATIGAANVVNVSVVCITNSYQVSGTVSGLGAGEAVTLLNNGTDALRVTESGGFIFSQPVNFGAAYAVTVAEQPAGQLCTVNNAGSGVMSASAVTNVVIDCQDN